MIIIGVMGRGGGPKPRYSSNRVISTTGTVPDLERLLKSVVAVKFEKQKQKYRNNSIFSKIEMINNSSLF
jgi:hypothetical protein